uniref:Uncharacterized protein n=1 Tax=Caenorhabditis japonica TaxID=281687 RepID=A0A8R1E6G6_CAEJA
MRVLLLDYLSYFTIVSSLFFATTTVLSLMFSPREPVSPTFATHSMRHVLSIDRSVKNYPAQSRELHAATAP